MYNKLLITAGGGIISSDQQAEQENCATIAIGLGGTGISCLRTLKKEVFTRVKPDDPDAPIAQYKHIKYLAVDTDKSSLGDTGSVDTLNSNTEFFNISCPNIEKLLNDAELLAQNPSFNWLKTKNSQEDKNGITIMNARAGAGGIRQIGRLLLIQRSKSLKEKLSSLITEALKELSGDYSINIHIFTGLSGGTGAGTFLDVCYILQSVLKDKGLEGQANTCGYFFMPDVNMASHPTDYLPINGFASMKELDYCMNFDNNGGEWNQSYDGFTVKTNNSPVKLAHLITATDSDGNMVANPYNYAMHVAVDSVLEYIIKPKVDESEDGAKNDFTIGSHVSNVYTHIGMVSKKHGATYNYCILGASNAYLPYKEITTYLTSKIFEGFSNLPKQTPFDADIDLFVKNNRLSYSDIYRELCDKMPSVPNIPVDHKTLYEQVEGINTDVIPQLLSPMREVGSKIAGQLQKNKSALLNSDSPMHGSNESNLALTTRIRNALIDIAKQADKGPYYASGMLHNLNARDLQKIVVGHKAENDRAIQLAVANIPLREKSLEQALNGLQNSNALNRKKRAEEYAHAVHAYYVQRYKIDALQKMGELLTEFEKQLSDLHNGYFSIFASVMRELQATFEANRIALSNPLSEDVGYAVKLMTIQDLQSSLDATVAAMDIPGQIHGFVSNMLNNPEAWISQDENRIFSQVNKYFLSQLSEYTSRTIDYYLRVKYETTNPAALQEKVYKEIITPLGNKAAPLFWNEGGERYKLSDSKTIGYVSIPSISDCIKAAADQYVSESVDDITVRPAWATDRISIYRFVCGVPLFGYKGVSVYKEQYTSKKITGSHLYEGSSRDTRDSRKLINVSPISCISKDQYTEDDIKNIELYDFAISNDIIAKVPIGDSAEYHLNIFDKLEIEALLSTMQKILDLKDIQKASAFISGRDGKQLTISNYRVIPIMQSDFAEIVVRDHILGSILLVQIMADQVASKKAYIEKLNEIIDLVDSGKKKTTDIHNFAMAVLTGTIKKINDYEFSYCYETFGVEESVVLTTIESEPYGMTLPLYSAYLGFCNQDEDVKQQVEKTIRDALLNKKEQVDSCVVEVQKWIASEKVNAMLSIAKTSFPDKISDIVAFFRQFAGEVTNFAATR